MCHPSPTSKLGLEEVRSLVALIETVRNVGGEPGVGLHPAALHHAVAAVLANPPAAAGAAGIRDRLFDLKQGEGEVFFGSEQGSSSKAWVQGKRTLSKAEFIKMPPGQRLGVLNGDKGVRM